MPQYEIIINYVDGSIDEIHNITATKIEDEMLCMQQNGREIFIILRNIFKWSKEEY